MHGAGLSVGILCQKGTMKPRSSSYITQNRKKRKKKSITVSKKSWSEARTSPALQHILHRWHQQLLVILCFLKDAQLLIGRENSICGNVCQLHWESVQAHTDTKRAEDARDVLCERRLSPWAFTKALLSVPPSLSFNCALMLSFKRLNASGTFTLIQSDTVETAHLFATFTLTGHIPQVQVQQGGIFPGS